MSCCKNKKSCKSKCGFFQNKNLLTIGMATYDDFDGVYFTTQSLFMYHKEILPYTKFIVIDNNPYSKHGEQTKEYCTQVGITYIPFADYSATTVKGLIFEHSETPYVLCMDSHVQVESGALMKLLMYYQCHENTSDLLQGPLLSEEPNHPDIWTHFEPKWRSQMYGIWSSDERGNDPNGEPFDIPMQGMGLFSCRRDAWVGFNSGFRGFGGEEWYIHEKFRRAGGRTLCLPFLRWTHRFRRPRGIPYKVSVEDKIRNYYIGFVELGLNTDEITNYFLHECDIPQETLDHLLFEAKCLQNS